MDGVKCVDCSCGGGGGGGGGCACVCRGGHFFMELEFNEVALLLIFSLNNGRRSLSHS